MPIPLSARSHFPHGRNSADPTGAQLPTEPDAVTSNATAAPAGPSASTVVSVAAIEGGFGSLTVTRKVADPLLPAASVAGQLTLVVPIGNCEPHAGKQTRS